ncbi:hypothetical protein QVD17_10669 [Tagetes erecta]|uniref:Uncharacterized protein n=1 Tax=Tagetes erecta TaxID=13708 RepID=A0AAD8L3E0_TARER|nr:hypothetical protein QVD17_10669 [Tagetes erecta]
MENFLMKLSKLSQLSILFLVAGACMYSIVLGPKDFVHPPFAKFCFFVKLNACRVCRSVQRSVRHWT